jgi:hypothetical protein
MVSWPHIIPTKLLLVYFVGNIYINVILQRIISFENMHIITDELPLVYSISNINIVNPGLKFCQPRLNKVLSLKNNKFKGKIPMNGNEIF